MTGDAHIRLLLRGCCCLVVRAGIITPSIVIFSQLLILASSYQSTIYYNLYTIEMIRIPEISFIFSGSSVLFPCNIQMTKEKNPSVTISFLLQNELRYQLSWSDRIVQIFPFIVCILDVTRMTSQFMRKSFVLANHWFECLKALSVTQRKFPVQSSISKF